MALRFKKNGICLSTGAGGGEERAERRVEFELRRAITMQSTSNRKVVPSPITTNQNSCKSFHDTMIEELNGERTGVFQHDHLHHFQLPGLPKNAIFPMVYRSVELLSFRKKFRKYPPFTDVVKTKFVFPLLPFHRRSFSLPLVILFWIKEAG
jgi:hypothetical protein